MAIKKSELYSSLWESCDELRGGMDACQYKDYVLVLLFIKYVSDKYAGVPDALITVPAGASFKDMVALKGKPTSATRSTRIIGPLAKANTASVRPARLQRPEQARQRQGDGGPPLQPDRHLREPGPRLLEEPRRRRRPARRCLRIPDAPLRHRERQEQGPVLHAGRGQPDHGQDHRHPRAPRAPATPPSTTRPAAPARCCSRSATRPDAKVTLYGQEKDNATAAWPG